MTLSTLLPLSIGLAVLMMGSATAHHSFAGEFDGSSALTLHGAVTRVELINPHSYIYLETRTAQGGVERWALEGPSLLAIKRRGWDRTLVKAGDELGVCGYAARRDAPSNRNPPLTGDARRLSAAVLIMPDGEKRLWENYGQGKCELDVRPVISSK
jgi:hypothetical protein